MPWNGDIIEFAWTYIIIIFIVAAGSTGAAPMTIAGETVLYGDFKALPYLASVLI